MKILKTSYTKYILLGVIVATLSFIIISFNYNGFGYILENHKHGFQDKGKDINLWVDRIKITIMALFSGGALGVAGAMLQKVTKNSLADISILGIGSINIIFITGFILIFKDKVFAGGLIGSMLPIVTLFASLLGTFVVWFFSKSKKASSQKFIIVGIALQLLFEALAVVLIDPTKTTNNKNDAKIMAQIKDYTVGMINTETPWWIIITASSMIGIVCAIVFALRNKIDLIEANEDLARVLGIRVEKTKFIVYILVAILAAAEAIMVGSVALLGIVAPAIIRLIFKNKSVHMLFGSFLLGGMMVMIASIISITLNTQLPVGILSTTIIIPYFIYTIIRSK